MSPQNFAEAEIKRHGQERLNDIGSGGLSFRAKQRVRPGTSIFIRIPSIESSFEAKGRVKWCRKNGDDYDVGVCFSTDEEAYRTRMVEQICHIEHYKRLVFEREGRKLSGEEAAQEWITLYAKGFPALDSVKSSTLEVKNRVKRGI